MLTIQEAIKQFGFEEGRVINTKMSSCPNAALVSARKPKSNAPFNGVANSSNSSAERICRGESLTNWLD
jgi:hypothetical protein